MNDIVYSTFFGDICKGNLDSKSWHPIFSFPYWPRFECWGNHSTSQKKGQDPDCRQLEAEFSYNLCFPAFPVGRMSFQNSGLKSWQVFFSHCWIWVMFFGVCCIIPKVLRELCALVFFPGDCKSNGADTCVCFFLLTKVPWDFLETVTRKKTCFCHWWWRNSFQYAWRGGDYAMFFRHWFWLISAEGSCYVWISCTNNWPLNLCALSFTYHSPHDDDTLRVDYSQMSILLKPVR